MVAFVSGDMRIITTTSAIDPTVRKNSLAISIPYNDGMYAGFSGLHPARRKAYANLCSLSLAGATSGDDTCKFSDGKKDELCVSSTSSAASSDDKSKGKDEDRCSR